MKSAGFIHIASFGAVLGATTLVTALMGHRAGPGSASAAASGATFVNWENHPIHSLEITPGGDRLLLANTPAATLEVFDIAGAGSPRHVGSVPVGLDPVSVRAQTDDIAWVVNHISDSVSRIDLRTMSVTATVSTADEPFDCVLAGSPARLFVSCSQANLVQVFDPENLAARPLEIAIDGEDPRALAVSPDGSQVYVAIFESGNGSTILGGGAERLGTLGYPPNAVSDPAGPYDGVNPPPNDGAGFDPPIGAGAASPPRVGLIVRKDEAGRWMDDNGGDWTDMVTGPQAAKSGRLPGWDLPDHDVAIIDTASLGVEYQSRLMNINMGIAVNPASGEVAVVGTDATNEVRFEPNVRSTFVRVKLARFAPGAGAAVIDLNPHLDYAVRSAVQSERDRSIGDPRAIVFNNGGTRAYVSGMGSNNVIVLDAAGQRAGRAPTIEVGEGPVGLALDESSGRLFVHNRFEGSISVVDLAIEQEVDRVAYHDPTPDVIRRGRPHFYSTHTTSGLGQAACASCHVDGRFDRLAWDLGDPSGVRDALAGRNLGAGIPGLEPGTTPVAFLPHHPMKGPMTTQTLQDIIGHEPHHWRGDRDGLEEFAGAFVGLNGADEVPSPADMQEFEDFLATIAFPPNPFRTFDNSLPASLPLDGHFRSGRFGSAGQPLPPGNAQRGLAFYQRTGPGVGLDSPFGCITCHTLPTGLSTDMTFSGGRFMEIAPGPLGEHHLALVSVDGSTNRAFKTAQLRNMHEKVGFDTTQLTSRAGFGFLHDGSVDSLARFISEPAFSVTSDQQVADLVAFMLAFSGSDLPEGSVFNPLTPPGTLSLDSHAAVGRQTTIAAGASIPAAQQELLDDMIGLAGAGRVDLIVKGSPGGEARGWVFDAVAFQADRAGETIAPAALAALARPGAELTWTVVPLGSGMRLGVDRDGDGFLDGDERAVCADPADPVSHPGGPGSADCDADFALSFFDFLCFQEGFAAGEMKADCDRDGALTFFDLLCFQEAFASCQ